MHPSFYHKIYIDNVNCTIIYNKTMMLYTLVIIQLDSLLVFNSFILSLILNYELSILFDMGFLTYLVIE